MGYEFPIDPIRMILEETRALGGAFVFPRLVLSSPLLTSHHQLWLQVNSEEHEDLMLIARYDSNMPYWVDVMAFSETMSSYMLGHRSRFRGRIPLGLTFLVEPIRMSVYGLLSLAWNWSQVVLWEVLAMRCPDVYIFRRELCSVGWVGGIWLAGTFEEFVADINTNFDVWKAGASAISPPYETFPRLPILMVRTDLVSLAEYAWYVTCQVLLCMLPDTPEVELDRFLTIWELYGYDLDPIRSVIEALSIRRLADRRGSSSLCE